MLQSGALFHSRLHLDCVVVNHYEGHSITHRTQTTHKIKAPHALVC
jgi:hypothetical protein